MTPGQELLTLETNRFQIEQLAIYKRGRGVELGSASSQSGT